MNKLNVFITIDTELWLLYNDFEKDLRSAIYGETSEGNYGVTHQLETFKQYDLNATFFVEPLFSLQYGQGALNELIQCINRYQQEIGLHIHTEWFNNENAHILENKKLGQNIKDYSVEEQSLIIEKGLELLKAAGAENITSFRAGNYGGNLDTLKALKDKLMFDTTYNVPYLNKVCDMDVGVTLEDTKALNGVFEYPVTYFHDYGTHQRHLQLTACSLSEIKHVLNQAYLQQRHSCTIVLHSFEWIKRIRKGQFRGHALDKSCLKRFHGMCKFLADNKDKFTTQKFENININSINATPHCRPIKSNIFRTLSRVSQQAFRRL